ncbi:serine/threonine protein kinase [Blastococcus sp. TBT05-19]|uniref:serine/threonine-protein kinase n=1 Tax=Blastococcus sp. TBT05-19 TaxID=2250581 RepID=UPI000E033BD5|nr:serine/threonine-protein kinase [Blastococcus sp. TBT05-19]RBY93992.1 serine/threonine protein kinase [Blastococcus sp. TBT05-19]
MTRPVVTAPGRLIAGRYRLESQIGGGGMGAVWLARDELLGRQVAIKQVLSPLGADERQIDEQRQRALREGRIAARLSHPHAISVYDVAVESGAPWLVMEYLPSRSLSAVLTEDGLLRVDQVAQIGAQVADALAATHAAGIVHRDVKPGNILIGQGGRIAGLVKITDFGISHARGDVTLTQTGQITGTPAYLAPEVAQGREMTEASDVFSLGATLYTCLEGAPPFGTDDNALGMLHRVAGGQVNPPQRAGSLTAPLMRMLAADPAERPSMTEVRDQLAKLAAGRDGDTTTVLLARTDVATSPGRPGTAVFPAVAVESTPAPAAAEEPTPIPPAARTPVPATAPAKGTPPVVAAPPPTTTGPAAEAAGPRRRRRWPLVAAVLGVALLAGLLVLLLNLSPDDPDESSADPSPSSSEPAPTSESEPPTTEPEAPTEETEPTTSEVVEEPAGDPLSAANITAFLEDYHQQVIADPAAAYDRTGPTLRANISRENYIEYWNQFSGVTLSEVQATDGQTRATGRLEWTYTNGEVESAVRAFTVIERDGQLILDSELDP